MAEPMFKFKNLEATLARVRRMNPTAVKALKEQLKTEVDELVPAIQRAMDAQYDSTDNGHLSVRDSVHAYPNPHRVISYFVIADAKDAHGKFIGANVEQGHRAIDGTHVAAQPAFWPTYRARKKPMQRRLSKAARTEIKQEFEGS